MSRLALFPLRARVCKKAGISQLCLDGHSLAGLAEKFGTPLYVYHQGTLDEAATAYLQALATYYPAPGHLTYAGKAFLAPQMANWAARRGLWVDCTGAGEIALARAGNLPRHQLLVHGVNKSLADLKAAQRFAGTVVLDSLQEFPFWLKAAQRKKRLPTLWLRLRPGQNIQTHPHLQTGLATSKFGFSEEEAAQVVRQCQQNGLPLAGLHFHLGSNFRDPAPLRAAIQQAAAFAARMKARFGWQPQHFSPGGGLGVAYVEEDLPTPSITDYVRAIARWTKTAFQGAGLPLPQLHLEPGRSLVARAGIALYRIGAVRQAGGRRWLLVDGGLADNPRPALYQARYTALPVREPLRPHTGPAWVGGPYCENGDVLIRNLPLPSLAPGELLAIPVSGAYQVSMGSNYNGALRPAILWLAQGQVRCIRKRERIADLVNAWQPVTST